jgi:hypothetical protein
MRSKAIATFVFGAKYVDLWKKHSEPNWRSYAEKHGYDVILLDKPIRADEDLARRPINWQKLLVCSHPEVAAHEDIVFLDADIMINYHRAPCLVSSKPGEEIGAVRFDRYVDDDFTYYQIFIRQAKFRNYQDRKRRRAETPAVCKLGGVDFSKEYSRYTAKRNLPLINTGVLHMKPKLHRDYLESVYQDSFRDVENGSEKGNYEQEYLSYRLIHDGMVRFLDERFNRLAYYEQALHYPFLFLLQDAALWKICLSTILANSFFLHFAGNINLMPFVSINENEDFAILGLDNPFAGDVEVISNRGIT